MSLINDALQRAKQQTAQPAPAPHLELRPLESEPRERKNFGVTFSIVLAVVIVAGLILIAASVSQNGIREASRDVIASTVPLRPVAAKVDHAPVAPATVANELPTVAVLASESASPSTNLPINVVEAPVPRPAPLKLQAVFYSAVRPSAMIAGKTVFVGDRVGGFQVAAITVNSATLVGEARTNILSFEE